MKLDLDFDIDQLSMKEQREKALSIICDLLRRYHPILPLDMAILSYKDTWTLLSFIDDVNHSFFSYVLNCKNCKKEKEEKL